MAVSIAIPKLGWGTEPLTLVEWKAKEGDWVEQGNRDEKDRGSIASFQVESFAKADRQGFWELQYTART